MEVRKIILQPVGTNLEAIQGKCRHIWPFGCASGALLQTLPFCSVSFVSHCNFKRFSLVGINGCPFDSIVSYWTLEKIGAGDCKLDETEGQVIPE